MRSNAERQAAYRARHRDAAAAAAGTAGGAGPEPAWHPGPGGAAGPAPAPAELLGRRADQTLQNLIRSLRPERTEEELCP